MKKNKKNKYKSWQGIWKSYGFIFSVIVSTIGVMNNMTYGIIGPTLLALYIGIRIDFKRDYGQPFIPGEVKKQGVRNLGILHAAEWIIWPGRHERLDHNEIIERRYLWTPLILTYAGLLTYNTIALFFYLIAPEITHYTLTKINTLFYPLLQYITAITDLINTPGVIKDKNELPLVINTWIISILVPPFVLAYTFRYHPKIIPSLYESFRQKKTETLLMEISRHLLVSFFSIIFIATYIWIIFGDHSNTSSTEGLLKMHLEGIYLIPTMSTIMVNFFLYALLTRPSLIIYGIYKHLKNNHL